MQKWEYLIIQSVSLYGTDESDRDVIAEKGKEGGELVNVIYLDPSFSRIAFLSYFKRPIKE